MATVITAGQMPVGEYNPARPGDLSRPEVGWIMPTPILRRAPVAKHGHLIRTDDKPLIAMLALARNQPVLAPCPDIVGCIVTLAHVGF